MHVKLYKLLLKQNIKNVFGKSQGFITNIGFEMVFMFAA